MSEGHRRPVDAVPVETLVFFPIAFKMPKRLAEIKQVKVVLSHSKLPHDSSHKHVKKQAEAIALLHFTAARRDNTDRKFKKGAAYLWHAPSKAEAKGTEEAEASHGHAHGTALCRQQDEGKETGTGDDRQWRPSGEVVEKKERISGTARQASEGSGRRADGFLQFTLHSRYAG
jgi:hypothetical protein